MCELLARPELTVITDATPEFSWIVNDPRRGAVQSAYRIVVASTADGPRALRGDVWDSGVVRSSKSVDVEYAGEPLAPGRVHYWRVRTWDARGEASPWSEAQEFRTGSLGGSEAPAGDPMDGCVWVWYPERPVGGTRYFRRRFDLPAGATVKSAELTLTVDDNFDLYVNGARVASTGSERNAWKTLRRVDVARHLRAGANVLAVAARNSGDAAGFTGKLAVTLAGRAPVTVLVDDKWRTSRSEEEGWERPGFDDGACRRAKVLGPYGMEPWKRTAQSPAEGGGGGDAFANRYPLVKTEVRPAPVARVGDGHWFVDFGRAAFGTVRFDADLPADGREVEVHLGEVATADGTRINRKPGGTRRYRMMKVRLQQGSHSYEVKVTPDRRNTGGAAIRMPADVGEVMPFRYCELVGYPGRLDASKVTQIAVHYPFDDGAAAFGSSSDVLNRVWELCKYSIKATSFVGVYVDGDRERIPYEADAYINQLCHYCVDREYTMARYSHEYLLRHPTWPLEWQHHSVLMAWEDYLYTGNAESLGEHYDVLAAKTLRALARGDGLIVDDKKRQTREFLRSINMGRQIRTIVDWPSAERDRHKITPVDSVANAFYYRTLVLMGRIARALGREDDMGRWDADAARVREAYQRAFLDAAKGIYRDGEGVGHSSLHANMFPLEFGLVPSERVGAVAAFVKSRGMAASVYGAQHLLDALYMAGEEEHALSLMASTAERSWFNMIRDGSTVSMEAWDDRFKPNQDWNHAWGAAPANVIPRRLMGVRPLEPGSARMIVEPRTGSLAFARLKTPTIRGPAEVEMRRDARRYALKVTVPANTACLVSLPCDDPARATEGGRALTRVPGVTLKGKEAGRTIVEVGGGQYRFEVRHRARPGHKRRRSALPLRQTASTRTGVRDGHGHGIALPGAPSPLHDRAQERAAGHGPDPPVRRRVHGALRGVHRAGGHARLHEGVRGGAPVRRGLRLGRRRRQCGIRMDRPHAGDRPRVLRGPGHRHPGRGRLPVQGTGRGRGLHEGRRVRPADRRPDRLPL
jgi:hypothetical protein